MEGCGDLGLDGDLDLGDDLGLDGDLDLVYQDSELEDLYQASPDPLMESP